MKKAWGARASLTAAAAIAMALAVGTSSAAAQVVVGQTAPGVNPAVGCSYSTPFDEFQTSVAAGNSYVVPAPGGTITSWSTNAGVGAGQVLTLKVLRPVGPLTFQVVAHDGPRPLAPSVMNTFPVTIPVQAGDFLGISLLANAVETACEFLTPFTGDAISYREGNAADGSTFTFGANPALEEGISTKSRLNISATILPPPAVSAISPASGSIQGGDSVVVAGANFAGVQGVSFGAAPAQSFTVDSEGQITAVSPASKTLGGVPITVTTISGTASSATPFIYEGCKVPQLKGKKLKAAKTKARKANCRLGNVKKLRDATAKTGKVAKQNPKSGKLLAPGAKINVTLKG